VIVLPLGEALDSAVVMAGSFRWVPGRHEAVSADAPRQSRRHHEPGGTKATIS
jgi:hypothetical protein